jgi:hypothetical protein
MAEQFYTSPRNLQIGNLGVQIKVRRLSHAVKRDLRNYFSNYALERETGMFEGIEIPAGAIEDLVVRRGLEELSQGGQLVQFNSPSPIDDFPDIGMGDKDGDIDLYEEVIKTIVDSNRFLARIYPFNMVFAQYLSMVNRDKAEYETKQAKTTGAEPDKVDRDDSVGPNPTPSQEATSTVQRIGGSELTGTRG